MEQDPPLADQPWLKFLHLLLQSEEVQPEQFDGAQKAEQKICAVVGGEGLGLVTW